MIVIIEGMDRCGKSTLVDSLRKHVMTDPGTFVHHSVSPPKDVKDPNKWELDNYRALIDFAGGAAAGDQSILFDRFHLGAYVYGVKYRGQSENIIAEIEDYYPAFKNDAILITLVDYPSAIVERDDDDSIESTEEDFAETYKSFIRAFMDSKIEKKIMLNITEIGGFKNLLPRVERFIDENSQ